MKAKHYAVLTGDLVHSSKLSSELSVEAMQWLREAGKLFSVQYPGSIVGSVDTFRHDSWQLLMVDPSLCIRAAVFFRASLKLHSDKNAKFDSRISVGIGEVEMIAESRISDSRGTAFTRSGRNLDEMERARIIFEADTGSSSEVMFELVGRVMVPLLDCVVTDWTAAEAHAIHGALLGLTQEKIARTTSLNSNTGRPVTRQAIGDSLDRGHWGVLEDVLRFIENNEGRLWGSL